MTAMQLADRIDVDPLASRRVQLPGLTVALVAGAAVPPACRIGRTRLVTHRTTTVNSPPLVSWPPSF
jgi:hypothetical protein